jgi:hypothetical protein
MKPPRYGAACLTFAVTIGAGFLIGGYQILSEPEFGIIAAFWTIVWSAGIGLVLALCVLMKEQDRR